MQHRVVGSRFGLSLGVAQVEVFASAAARAAVLEAERVAQVAAGAPADVTVRPTRLSELLVTEHTTRAGVHAVLRDVAEAQAQLHALQAAAIARLAERQPAQPSLPGARADDPADPDRPDDWVADEVAVVLGISVGSASAVVTKARALVEQLPQVWMALADGQIDVRRAQVLVDALADRKHSAGGGLADDLVDLIAAQGLGWIAEGIGPTPLADRIGGALIAADPAEADRRAERRKRKQNVTSTSQGDGLASLRTDLADAADVAQEMEVIDALAASMRRNGDKRPMGQLRVAAHHQLVTRPWEAMTDDVARARWQLRMRVDLADLDDLGPLLNRPDDTAASTAGAGAGAGAGAAQDPAADEGPAVGEGAATDTPEPGPGGLPALAHPDPPACSAAPEGTTSSSPPSLPVDADPSGRTAPPDGTRLVDGTAQPDSTPPACCGAAPDATGRPDDAHAPGGAALPDDTDPDGTRPPGGSGVGSIGGLAVSPVAVAELLARYDALLVTGIGGRVDAGEVWFEIVDATGRLRALTSPAQARAALRRGTGLGPPPAVGRYNPSAEQVRFVKARDRHCRFPGCARPAEYVDLDHVIPHDHDDPAAGGPTCVSNLVCLCRRHHRLKTHAPGWVFAMDPDGTLHVAPPDGRTRTTRPDRIAEIDMSTPTHLGALTDLLGPTPKRHRTPTPDERAQRRAAAADRARLAAEIEAELDAALARASAAARSAAADSAANGTAGDDTSASDAGADDAASDCSARGEDPPPF